MWDNLSEDDREDYNKVAAIIKDKVLKKEVLNLGKYLPTGVLKKVKENTSVKLSHFDDKCLFYVFNIRKIREEKREAFDKNKNTVSMMKLMKIMYLLKNGLNS